MLDVPVADGFYAVADPDGPDEPGGDPTTTLWRIWDGEIHRYPKSAIYGPVLPRHLAPADPEERYAWFCAGTDYYQLWMSRVVEALCADPVAAQFRFAEATGRCFACARVLRGAQTQRLGIGPACQAALPDGLVKAFLDLRDAGAEA